MPKINYLDLFSGIGGFRLGLAQAGFEFDREWHSETDHYANLIYHRHFPDSVFLGDIKNVKGKDLPAIDLITAGFPCQDISIANSEGKGIAGDRSGLVKEVFRITAEAKPKYLLFENVKNLLSKNHGRDFASIIVAMDELGYDCQWELLDSQNFGLAQRRQRVFIFCFRKGCTVPLFPLGQVGYRDATAVQGRQKQVSGKCISTSDGHKGTRHGGENLIVTKIGTLTAKSYGDKGWAPYNEWNTVIARTLEAGNRGCQRHDTVIAGTIQAEKRGRTSQSQVIARTIRAHGGNQRAWEETIVAGTLCTPAGGPSWIWRDTYIAETDGLGKRKATGFSNRLDSCRGSTLGNAVSVNVIKAIGEKLIKII